MSTELSSQSELENIFKTIKQVMKQRGLLYKDLAGYLEVSLPTVKRFFSAEDVSFERVLKICHWLDIGLDDLIQISGINSQRRRSFTDEQELFFAKSPHFYAYLSELQKGKSSKQIAMENSLSVNSVKKYHRELEKLNLIKIKNDEVSLLLNGTHNWDDDGIMGKTYSKSIIEGLSSRVSHSLGGNHTHLLELITKHLTSEDYEELKEDFSKLARKYAHLGAEKPKDAKQRKFRNY